MIWIAILTVLAGYTLAIWDLIKWIKNRYKNKPHGKRTVWLISLILISFSVLILPLLVLFLLVLGQIWVLGVLVGASTLYAFYKLGSFLVRNLKIPPLTAKYHISEPDINIRILKVPELKIPAPAFSKHCHVPSSTGRGKTKSVLAPVAKQFIELGKGVCVIDPKGDNEVINAFVLLLKDQGRFPDDFWFLDPMFPHLSNSYNPLYAAIKYRKPEHIAVMVIATMPKVGGTATFYENIQKEFTRAITKILSVLPETGKMANFMDLYAIVANLPTSIDYLLETYSYEINSRAKDEIYQLWVKTIREEAKRNKEFRNYLRGLQQHLATYAFTFHPKLLNSYDPEIKIADLFKGGKIGYFSLRALDFPSGESLDIGKMLLMDIQSYAAYKQRYNISSLIPDLLIIDEAQNVLIPEFQRMFEMARSAGIGIMILHQSKQQLDQIQRGLFENVFNNTNIKVILGIDDPETAKYLAEYAGQELKYFSTETRAGEHFLKKPSDQLIPRWIEMQSQRYDYRIRPEEFKNLKKGEGFVFVADPPVPGVKGKLDYFAIPTTYNLEKILPNRGEDFSWKDEEKGLCLLWKLKSEVKETISDIFEDLSPQTQKSIENIFEDLIPSEENTQELSPEEIITTEEESFMDGI